MMNELNFNRRIQIPTEEDKNSGYGSVMENVVSYADGEKGQFRLNESQGQRSIFRRISNFFKRWILHFITTTYKVPNIAELVIRVLD